MPTNASVHAHAAARHAKTRRHAPLKNPLRQRRTVLMRYFTRREHLVVVGTTRWVPRWTLQTTWHHRCLLTSYFLIKSSAITTRIIADHGCPGDQIAGKGFKFGPKNAEARRRPVTANRVVARGLADAACTTIPDWDGELVALVLPSGRCHGYTGSDEVRVIGATSHGDRTTVN
jgi:hypothetical protein